MIVIVAATAGFLGGMFYRWLADRLSRRGMPYVYTSPDGKTTVRASSQSMIDAARKALGEQ